LAKGSDDLQAYFLAADVLGADLHNAGLVNARGGKDGAKVKIVRQQYVAVGCRVVHEIGVWRIGRADADPVDSSNPASWSRPHQLGDRFMSISSFMQQ
jgi:hypothetical protein